MAEGRGQPSCPRGDTTQPRGVAQKEASGDDTTKHAAHCDRPQPLDGHPRSDDKEDQAVTGDLFPDF